jgi:hypothetical protein
MVRVVWQVSSAIDGNKETILCCCCLSSVIRSLIVSVSKAISFGDPSYCYVMGSKYSQHFKCVEVNSAD